MEEGNNEQQNPNTIGNTNNESTSDIKLNEVTETANDSNNDSVNEKPANKVCGKCGNINPAGQKFCGSCGASLDVETVDEESVAYKAGQVIGSAEESIADAIKDKVPEEHKSKISKKTGGIVLAAILVVIIIVCIVIFMPKSVNFSKEFSNIASESYCTISSDGSSMILDTNPYDIKDYSDSDASKAIKSANEKLGFTDALYTKMTQTRALDGTQTDSNDKVKVSWTYHPKQGLVVLYEKK